MQKFGVYLLISLMIIIAYALSIIVVNMRYTASSYDITKPRIRMVLQWLCGSKFDGSLLYFLNIYIPRQGLKMASNWVPMYIQ